MPDADTSHATIEATDGGPLSRPDSTRFCLQDEEIAACTVLRKEDAIALVSSALTVLQIGYVKRDLLRAYARQILTFQEGLRYRYEDPVEEIVEDFVWLTS